MLAAQVARYLGRTMASLFTAYPAMYRRHASIHERGVLASASMADESPSVYVLSESRCCFEHRLDEDADCDACSCE